MGKAHATGWFILNLCSRAEQALGEEAAFFYTGEDEEIAAAEGADVFFQRFAVEQVLDEDEAVDEVGLVADENQADVELAVGGEAAGVVEGAAVEQVFFHELGVARVGEPHVAVFGGGFAVGVFGEVGGVALFFAVHGGAAVFAAAEDFGLFLQGGSVPEFDEVADEADGLVAAVFRPGGFVLAIGGDARPEDLVGNFRIGYVGVAGAVAEA